jgi:hypothetical protein
MSSSPARPVCRATPPLLLVLLLQFCSIIPGALCAGAEKGADVQSLSPAKGPLKVHQKNPRYFDDGTGRAVYLTGSHTWYNFQDGGATNPPPVLDYDRYLDWMVSHNHNFIRLWVWEQARWAPWADGKNRNASDWFIRPAWAYERTGPGKALDGEPKYDLTQFNPAYFNRVRERVQKAQARGIYVSIMLFQGWSAAKGWLGGKPWNGHPYHPENNIQSFNGNEHSMDGPDLSSKALRDKHVAYLHRVIDAVNDLDNVLYEVTNEGGYKDWDWFIVDQVHAYEKTKPRQHPVGLTGHGSESNDEMIASPADWFSPGEREWPDLKANPREVDGRKVSLVDTDHVYGVGGDQQWVWKCFLRGHNVLFMDPYMDRNWETTGGGGYDTTHENARKAMGIARRYAIRMDLAATAPHNELASTTYCLANPGKEYLIYLPKGGDVTVDISAANGKFSMEWCHPVTGSVTPGEPAEGEAKRSFTSPIPGEAVLYLHR